MERPPPHTDTEEISEDLVNILSDAKTPALLLLLEKNMPEDMDWTPVTSNEKGNEFVLANKAFTTLFPRIIKSSLRVPKVPIKQYKLFGPDDVVTENSVVRFMEVSKWEADYWRDLLIHRLGVTSASINYAVLVDGKLFSVVGFSEVGMVGGNKWRNYICEMYGISVPSRRYKNLNKLLMTLLVSYETGDFLSQKTFRVYKGMNTTCLTIHPDTKNKRGLMKCDSRQKMKNGLWKLHYTTDWREWNWKGAIQKWLEWEVKYSPNTQTSATD